MSSRCPAVTLLLLFLAAASSAQVVPSAAKVTPNLVGNIDRPLRYRPDGLDFVIVNGGETFNRPLYGGNTAFRVDGGDRPEYVLYLPGRGGNLRLGLKSAVGAKWLQEAGSVTARYCPGRLTHEITDPWLGPRGVLRVSALAYHATEGMIVRIEAMNIPAGLEFFWAFGGVNGQRGRRDGDIGTENVPISEWFQLKPEFCRDNIVETAADRFHVRGRPGSIVGVVPPGSRLSVADANTWKDPSALLSGEGVGPGGTTPAPVIVGRVALEDSRPVFLSLQRAPAASTGAGDLDTYRAVTAGRPASEPPRAAPLAAPYAAADLPGIYDACEAHFDRLRRRVTVDTPDAFLNAAVAALNVAADAVWDAPQEAIMHGAIAWRTKLLGWRGPYALDALGWHERARRNFTYWMGRQNIEPIPAEVPLPDEDANLARNERGLHTNGDLSNSHYDMNLVFIDALFRHLQWTGDLGFAREAWPVIERHLAWERRLFRREFGPDRLPLYEAYAAIWASDDLQYSGGGVAHSSAYNYYHLRQASRLARLLGKDATLYDREADAVARGMRELLWLPEGGFAECKDWLGRQRVHPHAALWTFYHTIDSEVPTPTEAWLMTAKVQRDIPRLPVRGENVPDGLATLATSNWMPYDWSINNVVMSEAVHAALGFWQAGRPDEAWSVLKGSVLAAMFMGISPGNVGSMSYLDVYRRESQRDFADGSGVLSRALVEGLFGVKPDALGGRLRVTPGWPGDWERAAIEHPDFALRFERTAEGDRYRIEQRGRRPQGEAEPVAGWREPLPVVLQLIPPRDRIAGVSVNGAAGSWRRVDDAIGMPRIEIPVAAAASAEVVVQWAGDTIRPVRAAPAQGFAAAKQGEMHWLAAPPTEWLESDAIPAARARELGLAELDNVTAGCEPVDLAPVFNDRVTRIFKNEYRSPRSPFVSLALPKQGIGGWAGGVRKTAEIDDAGLQAAAGLNGGRILLPNGVPFVTAATGEAPNVAFVSLWDNYPDYVIVPVDGKARGLVLLLAGSTNAMQSGFENGEVVVTYADGGRTKLPLLNPVNWWPIEQDYFIDDFQFRRPGPLPTRIDLKTGAIRVLRMDTFKGTGGRIPGGAATVLNLHLDPARELESLEVRATANDVVIGLMAATLVR